VGNILAHRHRLTVYHYDYHDARGHNDRRAANGAALESGMWDRYEADELAVMALRDFRLRFEWVLDDLRALVSGVPIVAEGWGLRPELVAPVARDPRRMVVMIATEEFRLHQLHVLPRASTFGAAVADPETAAPKVLARGSTCNW
jgi:hypothetical protein